MDAELYSESVEYEKLTQAVYQTMLVQEGFQGVEVEHDVYVEGRSGVRHQIDVSWRFEQATVSHHVLVECKNYTSAITLEKVRNFFAVLHDIGNCQGIMVTKTGFQSGVVQFAEHYGIRLKLLDKPTEEDWEDRFRDVAVRLSAIGLSSQPGREPVVGAILDLNQDEVDQLSREISEGLYVMPTGPEMFFVDADGVPITQELRWWLPRNLSSDGRGAGGPYETTIDLRDHYIPVFDTSDGSTRCIKVNGLNVTYYYDVIDTREFAILGDEIVRAVLRDFDTGEIEHVHRHDDGGQSTPPPTIP